MDGILFKNRVAEAVHRAVCEFTGTDGCRMCMYYAFAGSALLSRLRKRLFIPQAGSLFVQTSEPNDPGLAIKIDFDGDSASGLRRGEFHCWIAMPETSKLGMSRCSTLIDFSSRHFKTLAENAVAGEQCQWTRPAPPPFVWIENGILPTWLQLKPDETATSSVLTELTSSFDSWRPLAEMSYRNYDRIIERSKRNDSDAKRRKLRKAERQRKKAARR